MNINNLPPMTTTEIITDQNDQLIEDPMNQTNNVDIANIERLFNVSPKINEADEINLAHLLLNESEIVDDVDTSDILEISNTVFSQNEQEIVEFIKARNESNGLTNNAPVQEGQFKWSKRINRAAVKKFFRDLTGVDLLPKDETLRLTGTYLNKDNEIANGTIYTVIQCAEDIIEHIIKQYEKCDKYAMMNPKEELKHSYIGASMSSAIFRIEPDNLNEKGQLIKAPGKDTFKKIKTFVLDMDSHVAVLEIPEVFKNKGHKLEELPTTYVPGKERFTFNSLDTASKLLATTQVISIINAEFAHRELDLKMFPSRVYNTGGGLQLHFEFDKWVTVDNVDKVYETFRNILNILKANQIKTFGSLAASLDDELVPYFLEFDASSADIVHTQRISGLVNDKKEYNGAFAYELAINGTPFADKSSIFVSKFLDEYINKIKNNFISIYKKDMFFNIDYRYIPEYSDAVVTERVRFRELKVSINDIKSKFIYLFNEIFDPINNNVEQGRILRIVEVLNNLETISQLRAAEKKEFGNLTTEPNKAVEQNILKLMTVEQQLDYISFYLQPNTPLETQEETDSFIKFNCPFHPETKPSFAVYKNTPRLGDTKTKNIVIAKDFHDDKIYNCITLIQAIKQSHFDSEIAEHNAKSENQNNQLDPKSVNRSEIIKEIISRFKLVLPKDNKKAIFETENDEVIDDLLSQVDLDNQIFYRRNNRSRDCIIRNKESGEYVTFDGTQMLTDQVLTHQLGFKNADKALRVKFHNAFCDKILEGMFEQFKPGADYVFTDDYGKIKYVNTWVPGKNYKAIKENAEKYDEMDINDGLALIQQKLPTSFYYLCQLTQKGHLGYFVNWLVCIAKFKVMSSIPVITSVQGTGKGVFVDEWVKYFLSNDYVDVVQSDRVLSQFNAFMETSQLIVLDEGDFSTTKEVDSLKFMTGNSEIPIEKKGIDSVKRERFFNFILLTNGDTPFRHPYNDRRISYQRLDVPLTQSMKILGFHEFDDFRDSLRAERLEFWSIISKIKITSAWTNKNIKNNQFSRQILQMHPFGKLVIQILEDKWEDISNQIIEGKTRNDDISEYLNMIKQMKEIYKKDGYISYTLINKYLESTNFKSYTSVIDFINNNQLHRSGITKGTGMNRSGDKSFEEVRIYIDHQKASELIEMKNNLGIISADYNVNNIDETLKHMDIEAMTTSVDDDVMCARTEAGHSLQAFEKHKLTKEEEEEENIIDMDALEHTKLIPPSLKID